MSEANDADSEFWTRRVKNEELPLKDLFVNRKVEFETDLDSLKILFAELNLPTHQTYNSA